MELNNKSDKRPSVSGPERLAHAGSRPSLLCSSHFAKQQRSELPVFGVKDRLVAEFEKHPTLIIIGETGCGKSTQIPQYVLGNNINGDKMIAITQPRRLAATSLSRRVAFEMNCSLGETVGYSIRFDEKLSRLTKILYLTEGMLLREALADNLLLKYSVIFLDEAHERNINTDVLFGIVKKAQALRSKKEKCPLKIIVMSATMDVDHFSEYFNKAPVIYIEGRLHEINIYHTKEPQADRLFGVLCTIRRINEEEPNGDILVFLSGSEEVEAMVESVKSMAPLVKRGSPFMKPLAAYASLPTKELENIFHRAGPNERKVIVATNVAETSITIPGIKYVVDSGLMKAKSFEPTTGLELLKEQKISRAQAWQRAGRAGREASGSCYRSYTSQEFKNLPEFPVPEILRCNLASAILMLAGMGIDAYTFDFMNQPRKELMDAAVAQLVVLGAIDSKESRKLTDLGKKMTDFPLDPNLTKIILLAKNYECLEEILSIVAVLSGESVFYRPSSQSEQNKANEAHEKFKSSEGDHVTLLNVYRQFSSANNKTSWCDSNFMNHRNLKFAMAVRDQLSSRCRQAGIPLSTCGQETQKVRKCLITGLFTNIAELQRDKKYRTPLPRALYADFMVGSAKLSASGLARNRVEHVSECLLHEMTRTHRPNNKSPHSITRKSWATASDESPPAVEAASGIFGHALSLAEPTLVDLRPIDKVNHRQVVFIHPSSSLRNLYPPYILYSEIVQTSKSYVRNVSVVDPDWLREIEPEYFRVHRIGTNDVSGIGA